MSVPESGREKPPRPEPARRPVAVPRTLVVEREHVPDPKRCREAVIRLLAPRPSPVPSVGHPGAGEIGAGVA